MSTPEVSQFQGSKENTELIGRQSGIVEELLPGRIQPSWAAAQGKVEEMPGKREVGTSKESSLARQGLLLVVTG